MSQVQTTLYFKSGSSDKVYHASIDESGDGFLVNFAYGKRGSSLRTGTKTTSPVDLDKATKIYEKLIKGKTSKGYVEGGNDGSGNIKPITNSEDSGISPQLLNEVDEKQAIALCRDDNWIAQVKHDGERRLLHFKDGELKGVNRKGGFVPLRQDVMDSFSALGLKSDCIFDGECMGDHVMVFDALMINGHDMCDIGFIERIDNLNAVLTENDHIKLSDIAITTEQKLNLMKRVEEAGGEGLVFKRKDSPYTAGRPNSGGDQLKYKFYATASVIVLGQNEGKRSVTMAVLQNGSEVPVGSVTIPANASIPKAGDILEVRYMYAYEFGGLFQPVYLFPRNDIDHAACVIEQLKYKPA